MAPARPTYQAPAHVQPVAPTPYVEPHGVAAAVQSQVVPAGASGAASCLMTREYQTEIIVGNQVVPGYGDACLQPDGSWLRLPAKPARY